MTDTQNLYEGPVNCNVQAADRDSEVRLSMFSCTCHASYTLSRVDYQYHFTFINIIRTVFFRLKVLRTCQCDLPAN